MWWHLAFGAMLAACGRLDFGGDPVAACASAASGAGPVTVSGVSGGFSSPTSFSPATYPITAFDASSDVSSSHDRSRAIWI